MPFVLRFSGNDTGAITFTGNTLGLSASGTPGVPGTNDYIGALVTTNTALQFGSYPPGTTNDFNLDSASAILRLLPASSILYAELVWAGTYAVTGGTTNFSAFIDKSVSVTTPQGTTVSVAPDPITAQSLFINGNFNYFRSANVTSLIQASGAGTYTVGGVVGNTENVGTSTGNQCGWTLCVVYENPTLPFRNLSLNVGIVDIEFGTTPSVNTTITGFSTPITGAITGRMQLCAGDGDPNKTGDQILFGPSTANLTVLSGPNNNASNFFASQINDQNGNLDTSGTFGTRNAINGNPGTLVVAGRQGWDITDVNISSTLVNNQTSAVFQLRTAGDGYSVYAVGIYLDINAPNITVDKSASTSQAAVGDTITYTVVVENTGTASADSTVVIDPLPNNTSFLPGSVTINGLPAPAGTDPAAGVPIGTLAVGQSATVQFSVTVTSLPPDNEIVNQATAIFQYQSVAGGPILDGSIPSNEVVVDVPGVALLDIIKTVSPTTAVPGDNVTYTFQVINTGSVTLTNVRIEDSQLGLIDILSSLGPGVSVILNAQFTIPPGTPAGTVIKNLATASSDQTGPVTDTAEVTVLQSFSLAVTKTPDRISVLPGDTVTYTITVTNTSNAPITNVTVTDVLVGFSQVIPSLAAGESRTFIVPFLIPPGTAAGSVFTNETTATSNETGPASDTATVIVSPVPNIFIIKTVTPLTAAPGETVTYTITVTNAGNQTLTNVRIFDPKLSVDQTFDALDPGDSVIITTPFTIPLTAMQGDTIVNVATVTSNQTGPEQSNAVVTVIGEPAISLVKSVSPEQAAPGSTVTYTFVVTNTGNTQLTNVVLTDPLLGLNQTIGTLAAGESQTINFPFIVPNTTSPFINTATATGTFDSLTVQSSDQAALILLLPDFTLTKTVDQTQANPGDTVQFTFTIVNTGGVPLTNVFISDPLLSFTNTIASLAPGATVTETIPFIIPNNAPGSVITNVVTVTPTEIGPKQGTASVTINEAPDILLTKTVTPVNALPGETVTYTVTVTNTGNINLTSVGVSDILLGLNSVIPLLLVGQSQNFTIPFVIPAGTPVGTVITNISTAVSDQTESVEAIANVLINPLPPAISIVKTPSVPTASPGDTVTYTITVTNTGSVTLTNVTLVDAILGISQNLGTFIPGQSQTLTFLFTIPLDAPSGSTIINTAVVTSDQTNPEDGPSTVTVNPSPGLQVIKTLDVTEAAPGQTVTALITVHNTGNVPLSNVVITDPTLNFNYVIPSLPFGSIIVLTIPFVVPNVAAGTVLTNTATASSTETGPTSSTAELTVLAQFQLNLVKSVTPAVATSGDTVTFTFEIRNTSNAPLTNLHFVDDLLGIDKTVDFIPPGFFIILTRTYTIPADAVGGTVITNTAVLSSTETAPISATAQVTVSANPKLDLFKTVVPTEGFPGEIVFFRMTGVNTGNVPLSNVRYFDPLLGLIGNVVSQDVGQELSLIIPFTIPETARPGDIINNTIFINSAQTGQQSASATVRVIEPPLTITKSADREVLVGDTFNITLTVFNGSQIAATDVVLTDLLQAGTQFVANSLKIGNQSVPGADPNIGVNIGSLAPGQSVIVSFFATQVIEPVSHEIRNQATASFRLAGIGPVFTVRSNIVVIAVEEHEE